MGAERQVVYGWKGGELGQHVKTLSDGCRGEMREGDSEQHQPPPSRARRSHLGERCEKATARSTNPTKQRGFEPRISVLATNKEEVGQGNAERSATGFSFRL